MVSMTSVSPSQWPRETPLYCGNGGFSKSSSSTGMMRALCTISLRIATYPGDWKIITLLL